LVLKTERLYNFLPDEIALIAQVGSENQARIVGDSVEARDLTANDRSQPTPKTAKTANQMPPTPNRPANPALGQEKSQKRTTQSPRGSPSRAM
jgi:hypothetical protein